MASHSTTGTLMARPTSMPYQCNTRFKAYQAEAHYEDDGMSEDSDASQDDMSTSTAPQTPLTLDKELPRRVIVDRGETIWLLSSRPPGPGTWDEQKSWMKFNSVKALGAKTAAQIMPVAKGRKKIWSSVLPFETKPRMLAHFGRKPA